MNEPENTESQDRQLIKTHDMGSIAVPTPKNPGAEALFGMMERITPVLPAGVASRQFCVAAMAEANALTKSCIPNTVAMSVFNCAVLGLMPGPALGHAYLVPYKKGKNYICQLIPGYKGFLDLAYANNFLRDVHADVVLVDEQFRFWKDGNGPQLEHEPHLERVETRENVVAAYCIYHTVNGGRGIQVVNRGALNKIDKTSSDFNNPWKTDYAAMAKKTAIRRAAKEWRITNRLGLAIQLDEQAERGEQQMCDMPLDDYKKQTLSLDEFTDEQETVDESIPDFEKVAYERLARDEAFLAEAARDEAERVQKEQQQIPY